MIPFRVHRATDVADAMRASGSHPGSRWIAGGTTLVDLLKLEVESPELVIDINGLPLRDIEPGQAGLRIGSLARMTDVASHPAVVERLPLLREVLLAGASPQLRNMASIGGNLAQRTRCPYYRDPSWTACNMRAPGSGCSAMTGPAPGSAVLGASERCIATHPADLPVALITLGACVHTARPDGTRRVIDLEDFYVAYGADPAEQNVLAAGEMITAVEVPWHERGAGSRYVKSRGRASYEFALAAAAVMLVVDGDERVARARITLGGVATKPWRAADAEAALTGRPCTPESFEQAAAAAFAEAIPRPDNAYKIELGRRVVVRALSDAAARVTR